MLGSNKNGSETGGPSSSTCPQLCPVCQTPADKQCSACHKVFYCSPEHQKKHWKVHKHSCRLFTVKQNEMYGRYLIATRDIPHGTIIFTEDCLTYGPKRCTSPICLGCHKKLVEEGYRCSKCAYPMCSEECEKLSIHAENECVVFQRSPHPVGAKITDFSSICPAYECITPLRCLLLKNKCPQTWEKLITMEHHNELRKTVPGLWNRNQINVVKLLLEWYKLREEPYGFDDDIIHSVMGYIDVNCFEIKYTNVEICGVYRDGGLMCHDCVPNTHNAIKITSSDHQMIVRSSVPIKKGEMITTSYANQLNGTRQRRWFLQDTKYFDCLCNRCQDPTEFATYLSGVKCGDCGTGYLLPRNPTSPGGTEWICTNTSEDKINNNETNTNNSGGGGPNKGFCNKSVKEEQILTILKKASKDIDEVSRSTAGSTISRLERLLKKYSGKILHPNHYLLLGIIKSLNHAYAALNLPENDKTEEEQSKTKEIDMDYLNRSKSLSLQLLSVLDMIDPGLTRLRGVTLFQMSLPDIQICQGKFYRGEISKNELKSSLEDILAYLKTSKEIIELDTLITNDPGLYGRILERIKTVEEIMESC